MDYSKITIYTENLPELLPEILIAALGEAGYESFTEEHNYLCAYIKHADFSDIKTDKVLSPYFVEYDVTIIKAENWNAKWEASYDHVVIDDKLLIYAPFHKNLPEKKHKVLISPKMSFGTGHHETTSLMCSMILTQNLKDKLVLDMGTGTGILGILSSKMGAKSITAIDIDESVLDNIYENVELNSITNLTAMAGDSNQIPSEKHDYILANINKNVLLADIPSYYNSLKDNGKLIISGFYDTDLDDIDNICVNLGLKLVKKIENNSWIAALFTKTKAS